MTGQRMKNNYIKNVSGKSERLALIFGAFCHIISSVCIVKNENVRRIS